MFLLKPPFMGNVPALPKGICADKHSFLAGFFAGQVSCLLDETPVLLVKMGVSMAMGVP